jgi:hypothetical protein
MTGAGTPTLHDEREVGAAVLLGVYWHVIVAKAILEGQAPREACSACCYSYHAGALPAYLHNLRHEGGIFASYEAAIATIYPGGFDRARHAHGALTDVPETGPHKNWTSKCYVAALEDDQELLRTPWAELAERHGVVPRARISTSHVDALAWQCHALWLLATGAGDLFHCARVAYDRALGRPRRRRQPVSATWLSRQVDTSLMATWAAICDADDGYGQPFWWSCPPDHYWRKRGDAANG